MASSAFLSLSVMCITGFAVACGDVISPFGDEFMLVTDHNRQAIFASKLRDIFFVQLPIAEAGRPWAVDYDTVHQLMFWTTYDPASIRRAHLDGSGYSLLVTSDITDPFGLAVDPETMRLYWTDYDMNTVEVVEYDGSNRRVISRMPGRHPTCVTINFLTRELYWAVHSPGAILRRPLDGEDEQPEIAFRGTVAVRGIAMNAEGTRVYWSDAGRSRVESADLSGQERRFHFNRFGLRGISWHDHMIYMVSRAQKIVIRLNETSHASQSFGSSGQFEKPMDITVVSSQQDPLNWSCNFDASTFNLCGWRQSYHDDFDWSRRPDTVTDQVSGNMSMFIDGRTHLNMQSATLISPFSIVKENGASVCVRFKYYMDGVSEDTALKVHFQRDNSSLLLWSRSGHQGTTWRRAVVDVPAEIGDGRFLLEGVVGTPESSDIGIDDVHYGECVDSRFNPNKDMRLRCDGKLTVLLKRDEYTVPSASHVRFAHSNCHGYDFDEEYIALSTDFEHCRTKMTRDDDNFYFSNVIKDVSSEMPDITVNCTVSRRSLVETSYRSRSTVSIHSEAYGNFTIAIQQYPGQDFEEAIPETDLATRVTTGDTLYMATSIASVTNLYILNERCWSTPTSHPADERREDLIINGLSVSPLVNILPEINNNTVQPFTAQAFQFDGVTDLTYLHCSVLVCDHFDSLRKCQLGNVTTGSRERRHSRLAREVNMAHIVSKGPFIVQKGEDDFASRQSIVIALMSACMVLLIVVIIFQSRRQNDRE